MNNWFVLLQHVVGGGIPVEMETEYDSFWAVMLAAEQLLLNTTHFTALEIIWKRPDIGTEDIVACLWHVQGGRPTLRMGGGLWGATPQAVIDDLFQYHLVYRT